MLTIRELAAHLFAQLPYSRSSHELKERVSTAMEEEYAALQGDQSELGALGELMVRCDTPEAAAALAHISPGELSAVAEQPATHDEKALKRSFRKAWRLSLLPAYFLALAMGSVVRGLLLLTAASFASAALMLLLSWLFYGRLQRHAAQISYDTICLSPATHALLELYTDRYKKRTINDFLLFTGLCVLPLASMETSYAAHLSLRETMGLVAAQMAPQVGLMLFLHSALLLRFLLHAAPPLEAKRYRDYTLPLIRRSGIFLAAAFLAAVLTRSFSGSSYVIYALAILFLIFCVVRNFRRRAPLMVQNLRINHLRITAFALAGVMALTLGVMRRGVYTLEPYIATVPAVPHEYHPIDYDNASGVYTITAGEGDFKLLHLTDIHLGGSISSTYKDYKALEACKTLIEHTRPDLVVITGDMVFPMGIMSLSLNNETPVREFAAFMRNIGIPWLFTYGNHDTEAMATGDAGDIDRLYQSLSYKSSGTLLYPYVQPEITGRVNQLVRIQNPDGSLRQALFLLDSNDYTGAGINEYDCIHDDQVDWYAAQVQQLAREEGHTVPSLLFFHIPLQQYREAWKLYESGSDQVEYYFGEIGETMIDAVCCSQLPSRLFDTAVELGSTQGMFCGHDHYNNISLGYRGIRLTYGLSIDYLAMPGIDKHSHQRGGEVITLRPDGSFDVEQYRLEELTK